MNYLLFLMFFIIVPVFMGITLVDLREHKTWQMIDLWCCGFGLLLAIIYVPALVGFFLSWTLTELTLIYLELIAVCCLFSLYTLIRKKPKIISSFISDIRGFSIYEAAALLLPAIHACITFFMMHVDDDDSAYVAAVTTTIDTNTLMKYDAINGDLITDYAFNEMDRLVTSPQYAFYAIFSKLFKVRPAVLCHTFFPPLLTLLFFACFYLVGRELFKNDRKKTAIFVVFTALVSVSSYFSVYTGGTFILVRSWQGKAQVVGFIIPMLLYLYLRILENQEIQKIDFLLHVVLMAGACLLTSMGSVFAMGESLLLLFLSFLILRKPKLLLNAIGYMIPIVMMLIYFKLG